MFTGIDPNKELPFDGLATCIAPLGLGIMRAPRGGVNR
jgi:hypothetical protein